MPQQDSGLGSVMALDAGTALERSVLSPHRNDDYYFTLRVIVASANIKLRFLRTGAKACCVPITVLLVIAALGPEKWAPRTELGWQFDHFIGYFGITLFFCFAWPRPFLVGGAFMAVAALLEGLQAFTPDRSAYLPAVMYGGAGALAAALVVELFMRAWRPRASVGAIARLICPVELDQGWSSEPE
jgi:VanZ family protein